LKDKKYDLIVIGSGAAGIMAALTAAKRGFSVIILEKLSFISAKLKATGGGKCNLTNTLNNEEFMEHFKSNGRFMRDALNEFDSKKLVKFMEDIGVKTHAPDGFRVFPISHSSSTIIKALEKELNKLDVKVECKQKVVSLVLEDKNIKGVKTLKDEYFADNVIVATGGLGYPKLGAEGDGYKLAKDVGHTISNVYPAMMPLKTKERWVSKLKADTISKVQIYINLKKYKKLKAQGDIIFTDNGIRGPVILDFAREITPLLEKYKEVPLILNLIKGKNQDELLNLIKEHSTLTVKEIFLKLLPLNVVEVFLELINVDKEKKYKQLSGSEKLKLLEIFTKTPLNVIGHDGFEKAMITRGGVKLKEINPKTMQSKIINGLYFCGEILDIDGPCGGYNLQWSFSSGYLAGISIC